MNHWTTKTKPACRWLGASSNLAFVVCIVLFVMYSVILILHLLGEYRNTSTPLDCFIIGVGLFVVVKRLRQHRQRTWGVTSFSPRAGQEANGADIE